MSRGRRKRGPDRARPLYARALRLDYLQLGGVACFFLFEGMVALAVLLSLAELVNWWSVLVLPAVVAGLVKINDLVASVFGKSSAFRRANRARGVARVPRPSIPVARGTAKAPRADAPLDDAVAPRQVRRRNANHRRFNPISSLRTVEPPKR
jgi:hypothetical protein